MKWLFAGWLAIHGLIHLMGFAKAFGYADLPQLTVPISRPIGLAWLLAAGLFLTTSVTLLLWPRGWWTLGALAILTSQAVIASSWADAKFGTLANIAALAGVILGFASQGPVSFRAEFRKDVAEGLGRSVAEVVLREEDVASLPAALRAYISRTGALGQPRVSNFHVTFKGRIRSGPSATWMAFTGEQYNFHDEPSRFFIMDAAMYAIPFEAFHRFQNGAATMRVKVASLFPVVDAKGPEMTRAETVTLFNDMCVFAPGSLVNSNIQWREIGARSVEGTFTNAGITIRAVLTFNDQGELVDFVSDDRLAGSKDGSSFTPMRWSTPLSGYRAFGAHTLSATGAGRWHPAGAEPYDYIQMSLTDIEYNVRSAGR